jgi:hypothetical protein
MEEESAVMADLRAQVRELTGEVARLRSVVRASEAHHRVMRDWADGLLRAARSSGLQYVDPPPTGEQPAIPFPAPPRPDPAATRHGGQLPPVASPGMGALARLRDPVTLTVGALAVHRLTRLVTEDEVTRPLRERITAWADGASDAQPPSATC